MRAPSLSVWEKRAFSFFADFEQLTLHKLYASEYPSLQVSSKHSDLGLKSESKRAEQKEKTQCNMY